MSEVTITDDASSDSKRRTSRETMSKLMTPNPNRRKSSFLKLAQSSQQGIHIRRMTKALLGPTHETLEEPPESKPKIRLENTYKMKPDDCFMPFKIRNEISAILHEYLANVTYDPIVCARLCCEISVAIKNKVKSMNTPRHKVICNVFISQQTESGIQVASRCLWDASNDSHACVTYKNSSLVAIGLVHGIFYE
ncbi:dynein light chain Tctex-type 5-B-like [Ylistrum balloti]|uniref:dynein light chain Tctex-type 5-B-like n=1 Tax=Ylistrum balloti TaxID=509963 RepID=UPI00290590EC|nr:dynein light chain Tctex-type 5-B-like [Ylistrum balloti]